MEKQIEILLFYNLHKTRRLARCLPHTHMEDLWTEAHVALHQFIHTKLSQPLFIHIIHYLCDNGLLVRSLTLSLVVMSMSRGVSPSSAGRSMMLFWCLQYVNMVFKTPFPARPVQHTITVQMIRSYIKTRRDE